MTLVLDTSKSVSGLWRSSATKLLFSSCQYSNILILIVFTFILSRYLANGISDAQSCNRRRKCNGSSTSFRRSTKLLWKNFATKIQLILWVAELRISDKNMSVVTVSWMIYNQELLRFSFSTYLLLPDLFTV